MDERTPNYGSTGQNLAVTTEVARQSMSGVSLRSVRSRASSSQTNPLRRSWVSATGRPLVRESVTMPNGVVRMEEDYNDSPFEIVKREYHLLVGFSAAIFFFIWAGDHHTLEDLSPFFFALVFLVIFSIILWHAFAVVRHADCLAVKLGEPYGTLILTLSVISIEVIMMAALMLSESDEEEPALARDTMFSVVMIVLNGMLGVTLILGGLRYAQQSYNLQSSQTFLNVIIPLSVLGLVLPTFTSGGDGPGMVSNFHAVFLVVFNIVLYGCFLAVQTKFHPDFFTYTDISSSGYTQLEDGTLAPLAKAEEGEAPTQESVEEQITQLRAQHSRLTMQLETLSKQLGPDYSTVHPSEEVMFQEEGGPHEHNEHAGLVIRSTLQHSILLLLSMAPISLLAEKLATLVKKLVRDLNAPHALAGFLVAVLVLSPEAMGAARAALGNKIQRTVNIALGSALSTIGLTIPAVVTISLIFPDKKLQLGLSYVSIVELSLTLLVTMTTFLAGRTNLLQGCVHLILFVSYVVLLFEEKDAHT